MEKNTNLLTEFPPISKQEWLTKLKRDLKGKPIEDLQWQLNEEITIPPFYHKEDAAADWQTIPSMSNSNDWQIGEDILVKDVKVANQAALHALSFGAESLRFVLENELSREDLKVLLEGIEPRFISIYFSIKNKNNLGVLAHFYQMVKSNSDEVKGALYFDFGKKIQQAELQAWMEPLRYGKEMLPHFDLLVVDAMDLSSDPKDVVSTLVETILRGIFYVEKFTAAGLNIDQVQANLQFSISIGKSYFVEIAKIRALKVLWGNVLKAYNSSIIAPPTIDAHLAMASQSEDANSNMIQSTTQAMSAIIAGVDRLTILPSDNFQKGKSSEFSKRIARNVQHILKMESFMDRVIDPSAGSYYIEKLTEQLAEAVWEKL